MLRSIRTFDVKVWQCLQDDVELDQMVLNSLQMAWYVLVFIRILMNNLQSCVFIMKKRHRDRTTNRRRTDNSDR